VTVTTPVCPFVVWTVYENTVYCWQKIACGETFCGFTLLSAGTLTPGCRDQIHYVYFTMGAPIHQNCPFPWKIWTSNVKRDAFGLSHLPSNRHHRSNGNCLKGKGENYQVCSVQYCVQQLCAVKCTHIWTDITVLWIGFCLTGPISLCLSPVYTIQPVVKPVWSNRLSNRFDNRVNVCIHNTTGCQSHCQTGCTTRFNNRLG